MAFVGDCSRRPRKDICKVHISSSLLVKENCLQGADCLHQLIETLKKEHKQWPSREKKLEERLMGCFFECL